MVCYAENLSQIESAEGKSGAILFCVTTSAGFFIKDTTMKTIPLTQGKVALVDDEDFEQLNQHKWCVSKAPNTHYAYRGNGILMHRKILGLKRGDGIDSDHKDGNGLNNQRYNLRRCSRKENIHNQRIQQRPKTSQYKGVNWDKRDRFWRTQIKLNGKSLHIGCFKNEVDAALAYDRTAKRLFGEFAFLNFPC